MGETYERNGGAITFATADEPFNLLLGGWGNDRGYVDTREIARPHLIWCWVVKLSGMRWENGSGG